MTNFIPIFPLGIVVYPGENLNLHIFESRYKQLITECHNSNKPFGIPVVLNQKICELGTLVEITEITKQYDNGEMDIKTKGLRVFRVLELLKEIPEKLYSGAIVNYPHNVVAGSKARIHAIVEKVKRLHTLLHLKKEFNADHLLSYELAHHVGLTMNEEYELLGLFNEIHREEYLKRHLEKVLPIISEMESLKQRVKLNGHFKNLKGLE
jgi:hypothetical protein